MSLSMPVGAQAQDATPPSSSTLLPAHQSALEPVGLTGDWGGLRSTLADDGVTISAGITSEVAGNVTGGAKRDATESGQFALGSVIDTGRLLGLTGGSLNLSLTFRRGDELSATSGLGLLQQPQEIFGRGRTSRISQLWYGQQIGKIVDIKFGRMTMGDDFAARACDSSNLTFCGSPMGNLVGDYWYNGPVTQWGARVRVKPGAWSFMIGVFEYNPNNLDYGISLSHGGAKGVTVPIELGRSVKLGSAGLPGLYRIGTWYNNAVFANVYTGVDGRPFATSGLAPLEQRGRYGGYAMVQQQLTGRFEDSASGPQATHGLVLSAAAVKVDERAQQLDSQISMGLSYTGIIGGRPHDVLSLNIGRNHVNPRAAATTVLENPGLERPSSEYVSELYYGVHVFPWLLVSPNVQYIVHPGGYADMHDVLIFGVKTSLQL